MQLIDNQLFSLVIVICLNSQMLDLEDVRVKWQAGSK